MDNKLRILAIAIFPAPYRSAMFSFLSKKAVLDGFYERDNDFGRVRDFFSRDGYPILNSKENKRLLSEKISKINQYNAIVLYDYTSRLSRKIMRKAIMHGIPYFVNCDGVILNKKKNIIADFIKRYYIKRASRCFASGKYAKEYFSSLGAKTENIIIHNFTTLFEKDILSKPLNKNKKIVIREKYQLPIEKMIFVGVGRFITIKNFEFLLNNYSFSNNSCLVLIGGGELKEVYESIIRRQDLINVILIDFMNKQSLLEILSACDFFVHPTLYDAWGLVINEAMARGLPVISSDMCVAALELVDENNGYLFKDSSSFIDAINKAEDLFLNKQNDYLSFCYNSISKIKKFTIEKMGETQLNGILEVADNQK